LERTVRGWGGENTITTRDGRPGVGGRRSGGGAIEGIGAGCAGQDHQTSRGDKAEEGGGDFCARSASTLSLQLQNCANHFPVRLMVDTPVNFDEGGVQVACCLRVFPMIASP